MGRCPKEPLSILARLQAKSEAKRRALQELIDRGPPSSGITPENWRLWHEYNYFLCPRRRHRTCCEPNCQLGARCTEAQAYGLTGDGRALPRKLRPACGVRTRSGEPCVARVVPGKRRCRMHGGLSTGPRTADGRARIGEAQRRRWARWRGDDAHPKVLAVFLPGTMHPDEICGLVADEPEVRAVPFDRANSQTCRALVAARLAAQARIGIAEADRAPLYSGEVEAVLVPIMFRMYPGDERAVVAQLRNELTELYAEFAETVLRFMLNTYRHGGTEALQRAAN